MMANPKFNKDPLILELRKRYPKRGPDPKKGEDLNRWAERYLEYMRGKQDAGDGKA